MPANPLNVGQVVNNASDCGASNVFYHELDLSGGDDAEFGPGFRCQLPNVPYESAAVQAAVNSPSRRVLRIVPLIATRDIAEGEELYSSYLSIV